ncbi:MAG: tryptophanase [Deltaproteobacteria bacterium]|nr:tryptophanase [Deltaproteobacteria bacterium]
MRSEPFKLKDVKRLPVLEPHQRVQALLVAGYNPLRLRSDQVIFDLVARGTSAWSHFQKAALEVGDEAYAGARNFFHLEDRLREVFGVENVVPTHNGLGAEKLLATTLLRRGQVVAHNRGHGGGLVEACGGVPVDVCAAVGSSGGPGDFGGDVDLARLEGLLREKGRDGVAYVHLETCPEGRNGQPVSLAGLAAVRDRTRDAGVPLVLDLSCAFSNAFWNRAVERPGTELAVLVREMAAAADVVLLDAVQDARCDIGGLIASRTPEHFERFRTQVVVFEGLHTYGGMSGRAMEVFATGVGELAGAEVVEWHQAQIGQLHDLLVTRGLPVLRSARGVVLDVDRFLPGVPAADHRRAALAACLYLGGGLRGRCDGPWSWHASGPGAAWLPLDLPRAALSRNHLLRIADVIAWTWERRESVRGLRLLNTPEFADEALLAPVEDRVVVPPGLEPPERCRRYEPYRTSAFEPLKVTDEAIRRDAMARAGYNTFLLRSEDIFIDFLTDSGTAAMSTGQWEGMADVDETPYGSRSFHHLEETFRELLGYRHVIPTHQGRAAEHIMSQVMIRPGQIVPGNMYFTTTKLHQEMAGGVFTDVIVDEAHDAHSGFPWKGNIDPVKLESEIRRVGAENVAYISFEMSVNMAGGQPFSMDNAREICGLCHRHGIPVMFDATRVVENAEMIRRKDPAFRSRRIRDIVGEMLSYGDGCTISCKKDFLVNMGGMLACNDDGLAHRFRRMLRIWEGDVTSGGMAVRDMEAMARGLVESMDDDYIRMRVEQTQEFGEKLLAAGIPIVTPPGSHAIFIDAKRFLPHVEQEQYPAQALASAIYIETGVRTMERGNVSKGRNPATGENYRPKLELVRCTIPRRVYTPSHFDFIVEGIARLFERRDRISGLEFVYEPPVLRFFQGRFTPLRPWDF